MANESMSSPQANYRWGKARNAPRFESVGGGKLHLIGAGERALYLGVKGTTKLTPFRSRHFATDDAYEIDGSAASE